MWHIKFNWIMSTTTYTEKRSSKVRWGPWGGVKSSNVFFFQNMVMRHIKIKGVGRESGKNI